MQLELLPLLKLQRDLLDQPRGMGRFQTYLKTLVGPDGELALPLTGFNPMSKPHVADILDKLIAMDADAIAEEAMHKSGARLEGVVTLRDVPSYRFSLVVVDDAQGGWTNRYLFEAKDRFENRYALRVGFITALMWSSEIPTADRVRLESAAAIYRTAWLWVQGLPKTLGNMLRQEGMAARFASAPVEPPPPAIAALVREHLESRHYPTQMACLYGDDAAGTLGYPRIGMPAGGALPYAAADEILAPGDPVDALTRPPEF